MAAGVAHSGEGIVFGADGHVTVALPGAGGEGGVEPESGVLHRVAEFAEEGDEAGRALSLLVGQFRILVHPAADVAQPLLGGLQPDPGCVLAVRHDSLSLA